MIQGGKWLNGVNHQVWERQLQGWLWAPIGFSENAKKWARGKPIRLLDDDEIGKLVEIAFGGK
jgi:hypothetical protein